MVLGEARAHCSVIAIALRWPHSGLQRSRTGYCTSASCDSGSSTHYLSLDILPLVLVGTHLAWCRASCPAYCSFGLDSMTGLQDAQILLRLLACALVKTDGLAYGIRRDSCLCIHIAALRSLCSTGDRVRFRLWNCVAAT